jgi:hypothetical protein
MNTASRTRAASRLRSASTACATGRSVYVAPRAGARTVSETAVTPDPPRRSCAGRPAAERQPGRARGPPGRASAGRAPRLSMARPRPARRLTAATSTERSAPQHTRLRAPPSMALDRPRDTARYVMDHMDRPSIDDDEGLASSSNGTGSAVSRGTGMRKSGQQKSRKLREK